MEIAALRVENRYAQPVIVWSLTALIGLMFVWLLGYLPWISTQDAISMQIPWVPRLGLYLSFYLDGLALFFGLIVTGIGAIVILYAGHYFEELPELLRF